MQATESIQEDSHSKTKEQQTKNQINYHKNKASQSNQNLGVEVPLKGQNNMIKVDQLGEIIVNQHEFNREASKQYFNKTKENKQKQREEESIKNKAEAKKLKQIDFNVITKKLEEYETKISAPILNKSVKTGKSIEVGESKVKSLVDSSQKQEVELNAPKKKGRPKKIVIEETIPKEKTTINNDKVIETNDQEAQKIKNKRGRPQKVIQEDSVQSQKVDESKKKDNKLTRNQTKSPDISKSISNSTQKLSKSKSDRPKIVQKLQQFQEDDKIKLSDELRNVDKTLLNEQDLIDLEELKALERLAGIREKSGYDEKMDEMTSLMEDKSFLCDEEIRQLELIQKEKQMSDREKRQEYMMNKQQNRQDQTQDEMSLDHEQKNKNALSESEYLSIFQIPGTSSLRIDLKMPAFDFEKLKGGKQIFSLVFEYEALLKIRKLFQDYEQIRAYTDGSSIKNPGRSGSSCVFMGIKKISEEEKSIIEYANQVSGDSSHSIHPYSNQNQLNDNLQFMFGLSLFLGETSNNYAEYMGVIMAQLLFSMFQFTEIQILTDSELIVNQVKGVSRTANVRLVELLKIVHSLAFKFESVCLDYVRREENIIADALAKDASSLAVGGEQHFKIYFRLEQVMANVQLKNW
ncbi:ribonuclease h [Stylonychia lemnae]|uniref:Ribonuclease h n=1 Tax=Stylonychia lemnae TaxID=5949 RepID=A0A078A267_STYLE|nr:ribonuclease h [Stylonychia lemnae]|eukprot:CDW74849.1 ribonuclease h [Stylonychia lemnae]